MNRSTESSPAFGCLVRTPIVIVGSPRSGTTLLGNLVAAHADVAYWEEPRTIWSQGNAWRPDDRLDERDLTPAIARRIDRRFHRFLAASGCRQFAEKTPSNCLRLRFIHALYPDARVVHLIRDGRAVVASMLGMLEKAPDRNRISARLRETPWRDLPALVPVFFRDVFRRGRKSFWGPRPPGWRDWLDLPAPAMLARQWRALVTAAREDLAVFPAEQRIELRYEDLVENPEAALERIRSIAGLKPSPAFVREASRIIVADGVNAWQKTLDPETIATIETETGPLLEESGCFPFEAES